jgi:hypothetical protein
MPEDHSRIGIPQEMKRETIILFVNMLNVPDQMGNKDDIEIYIRKIKKGNTYIYNHELRYTLDG